MSDGHDEFDRLIRKAKRRLENLARMNRDGSRVITVDKRTHRIRFEGETEEEVTIVIEKKDDKQ